MLSVVAIAVGVFASTNVDDLVWAWAGYSGTNGPTSESPVGHLEFLIDRFGYVRARWRGDQQALAAVDAIIAQSRMLAAERELLPPPDQHAH